MKSGKKVIRVALAILCMVSMLFISEYQKVEVYAASGYGFIFLSAYEKTLKTGDTYCLSVVSSGSKKPTFTSSDSKVVSVNTYGKITAKKADCRTFYCHFTIHRCTVNLCSNRSCSRLLCCYFSIFTYRCNACLCRLPRHLMPGG